jgi:hypothetical protein
MKIKKTLYIQAEKYSFDDEFSVTVSTFKSESDQSRTVVDIAEHEIELEVPDLDQNKLTLAHIDQLKKMKVKVMAENEIRLVNIEGEIQKLMALECER